MVAEDNELRCKDCVWAVKVDNSSMVFCNWQKHDVYGESMPCPNFELYCEPF